MTQQQIELKSAINRIVADLAKGKKLVRLMSGKFCFIVGNRFRQLEHQAIDKLIEEKMLHETFKSRGIRHYQLI
jgi:hypothetical protein